MKTNNWLGALAVVGVAGLALSFSTPGGGVSIGDSVSHSFRDPVLNGLGAKSLSDLKGKPVLVEFWGTR